MLRDTSVGKSTLERRHQQRQASSVSRRITVHLLGDLSTPISLLQLLGQLCLKVATNHTPEIVLVSKPRIDDLSRDHCIEQRPPDLQPRSSEEVKVEGSVVEHFDARPSEELNDLGEEIPADA